MTTQETVNALIAKLEAGLRDVWSEQHFTAYLSTIANFRAYSVSNTLLIYLQRPTATYVAGYQDWRVKYHRQVKKNEKGIRILCPCTYQVTEIDENGNEVKRNILKFKSGYVFDIEQTVGDEIPSICKPLARNIELYPTLLAIVMSLTTAEVRICPSHVRGYYRPADNVIVIDESLSQADQIKTLLHEVAHSILHSETGIAHNADTATREIQAEAVAYVVCQYLGIECTQYSCEYLASWSNGKSNECLRSHINLIKKTSADLIDRIDPLLRAYQ